MPGMGPTPGTVKKQRRCKSPPPLRLKIVVTERQVITGLACQRLSVRSVTFRMIMSLSASTLRPSSVMVSTVATEGSRRPVTRSICHHHL